MDGKALRAVVLLQSPMGSTALAAYLGDDKNAWKQYDATELAKTYKGPSKKILIDQGTSDNFWKVMLRANAVCISMGPSCYQPDVSGFCRISGIAAE